MLPYEITIEISAMNRPLGEDELLKAAVSNEMAWKTARRTPRPSKLYTLMFETLNKYVAVRNSSFSAYQDNSNRSLMKFEYMDADPNSLVFYFGKALKSKSGVAGYESFCRRFKCAMKITVVELDYGGYWICDYCSPDGKKETRTEGEKGQPSRSLDDFIAEWQKSA